MKTNQKGFGVVSVIVGILVLAIIGFAGWKVLNRNSEAVSSANIKIPNTATKEIKENEIEVEKVSRLSDSWLLRESVDASIRVPDGFKILAREDETLDFYLPDAPQGSLKYTQGEKAEVVGSLHKHFELGIIAGFNNTGWNDRGEEIKTMETYSGLEVKVKEFKQTEVPDGVDYSKGTTLRQYTVIKGENSFTVDYAYMEAGIVDIIEEMVKSVIIK